MHRNARWSEAQEQDVLDKTKAEKEQETESTANHHERDNKMDQMGTE